VLNHYYDSVDKKPSGFAARRAGELVTQFLCDECGFGAAVKVATFSKGMQERFAQWSAETFEHSPSYVSRNLSVIAAAFRYGTKDVVRRTPEGDMREVRMLRFAPNVYYDKKWLAEVMDRPEPGPRDYIPSFEDLASLLDMPGSAVLRRYDIIALNTWARPQAIVDLRVSTQVDLKAGLVDLNPPGRRQTKKRRPLLRLTKNLRAWLELWGDNAPLSKPILDEGGEIREVRVVSYVKKQFNRRTFRWMLARHGVAGDRIAELEAGLRRGDPDPFWAAIDAAEAAGIRRVTRYTIRHFMATQIRNLAEVKVDREQRRMWLGHVEGDTTSWYETHDPEYLQACADGTDLIIARLDALTTRPLVPKTLKARIAGARISVVRRKA